MDEKCVRATVCSVETVFKESAEVPIDIEFNLPDYCPEVSRILKCRAVPRVSSKAAAGHGITVDGSVTVTVIYADREENINSYEYQYPFSKSFETGVDVADGCVTVTAKCEYVNCRAVTERKIDIHGATGIGVTLTQKQNKEIVSDIEDENVKVRRRSVTATVPVAEAEKYVILEEEIEVGGSQPDIKCLIRYDAAATVDECKLLADKAIVKGSMAVNLLYRGEEGEPQSLFCAIPFSQLMEIEGANEEQLCEATADVAYLEIKPKFASSAAARAFSLDGKLAISVKTFKDEDIGLITDAYSLKYAAQITSEDICVRRLVCGINDTFTAKGDFEISGASISKICDIWCDIREKNARFEGDCLIVYGTANAGIIAADSGGAPQFFEKPLDFEYTFKLPAGCESPTAVPNVSLKEINYTLSGESSMEMRAQMAVTAAVYDCRKLSLLSGVTVDESKPQSNADRAAMTVYFAEPGECLWDISKRYSADAEKVMSLNKITEDRITKRQMILLPGN